MKKLMLSAVAALALAVSAAEAFLPSGRLALGANYWASHAATQMWSKWNADEVEKDLAALEASGMTMLRVVVNNSPTPYAGAPKLLAKWKVVQALTDDAARAKWADGRLELGANSGILLMMEKERAQ